MDMPPGCKIDGTTFEKCWVGFNGDFTIPAGITTVGYRAFCNCSDVTAISIPDGVTEIGYGAFMNCISLTRINIPEGVASIGDWAFAGCSNITSIHLPDGVTRLGYGAFHDCHKLTCIVLPTGCRDPRREGGISFSPTCQIFFNGTAEYRLHLAKELAAGLAGDGVDVVGMHEPQSESVIDSRGGRDI